MLVASTMDLAFRSRLACLGCVRRVSARGIICEIVLASVAEIQAEQMCIHLSQLRLSGGFSRKREDGQSI